MGHSVAVPLFFCLAGGRTGPSAMHGAEGWQRAEGVSPRLRRPSPDGVSELNFPREPVRLHGGRDHVLRGRAQ